MADDPTVEPPDDRCSGPDPPAGCEQVLPSLTGAGAPEAVESAPPPPVGRPWVIGMADAPVGSVAKITTQWGRADRLGAVKVRLGIGRMRYTVPPGLYAVGDPTGQSPVLVSANYKLSFDHLRRRLGGLDAWVLVLDTRGVNVWCSAAKGTFGTEEIVRRVAATEVGRVVEHRTLIVPQLAAPGVAAHEVQKRSGFRVVYGPVRAADIGAFLAAGMRATPEMRRVRFDLPDRLAVVPMELRQWGRYALAIAACLLLLAGLGPGWYDASRLAGAGLRAAAIVLASLLAGGLLVPALLPWLPGRAFSIKGAAVGVVLVGLPAAIAGPALATTGGKLELAAWLLLAPAMTAFMAMNFTGASTCTSLSGVQKEMRLAVPLQVAAAAVGLALWIGARFA